MLNSINHSSYFNNCNKVNANKYFKKNDDKLKDKLYDFDKENNKQNNSIVLMNRRNINMGTKKNENKIRINHIEKKEKNENKENIDNNKNIEKIEKKEKNIREIKIKNEKKENFIKYENIEKKEDIDKKEEIDKKEDKDKKEDIEKGENSEKGKNIENKEETQIKEEKQKINDFIVDDDKLKVKYFDISKINNIQIPKEYINVIYYNLLKEEEIGIQPMPDYTYMTRQNEINDKMRSILIDWLIDVHFKFGFTDETLFMTISIIDRYLSICPISRANFQLLGITALMIACKHEEIDLPKIDDFIYITDNAYTKNEVIKMEEEVLYKLNFSFVYPSPIKFFEYISLHFNFSKKYHMMGKYLMESFLLDVKNVKYKPSIISCACAYIVMKFFKMKNYQESYNKKFYILDETVEKYNEHNVKECAKDICLLVDNISKTNYQACLKKYSKPEQEKVSIIIMNN